MTRHWALRMTRASLVVVVEEDKLRLIGGFGDNLNSTGPSCQAAPVNRTWIRTLITLFALPLFSSSNDSKHA